MSQDFFTSNIGKTIIRIDPTGYEAHFEVFDYEAAKYFHDLQEHGFEYKPVVHTSANVCVACEG